LREKAGRTVLTHAADVLLRDLLQVAMGELAAATARLRGQRKVDGRSGLNGGLLVGSSWLLLILFDLLIFGRSWLLAAPLHLDGIGGQRNNLFGDREELLTLLLFFGGVVVLPALVVIAPTSRRGNVIISIVMGNHRLGRVVVASSGV